MYSKELIKSIPISQVCESLGLEIKKCGSRYSILCPFHNDTHYNSCVIRNDNNTFYCYSCGAKGDNEDLVEGVLNISFKEAMEYLGREFNIPQINEVKLSKEQVEVEKQRPFKADLLDACLGFQNGCVEKELFSVNDLYRSDRLSYYDLIIAKAKEKGGYWKAAAAKYLKMSKDYEDLSYMATVIENGSKCFLEGGYYDPKRDVKDNLYLARKFIGQAFVPYFNGTMQDATPEDVEFASKCIERAKECKEIVRASRKRKKEYENLKKALKKKKPA